MLTRPCTRLILIPVCPGVAPQQCFVDRKPEQLHACRDCQLGGLICDDSDLQSRGGAYSARPGQSRWASS